MILNVVSSTKKRAFSRHLRIWATQQAQILRAVVNLFLPIEQKFTKMRFSVLDALRMAAWQGFARGLNGLLRRMISMPELTVVGASAICDPRYSRPNLRLDKHGIKAL
jgi:hypothetical protein